MEYDFYISYCPQDIDYAVKVKNELQNLSGNDERSIRIHAAFQDVNPDASWQEAIYDIISKSMRVIVILTPNYLKVIKPSYAILIHMTKVFDHTSYIY